MVIAGRDHRALCTTPWLVLHPQEVHLDLKGALYHATICPLPSTALVVHVGADEARVECVLSDFLQLREQGNIYGNQVGGAVCEGGCAVTGVVTGLRKAWRSNPVC